MTKQTATVEQVKDAYLNHWRRRGLTKTVVPRLDLAEALTGQQVYGDTYSGVTRESNLRKLIDMGQFDASIKELIDSGWLIQISDGDAHALHIAVRGGQRNARYYISTEDHAAAVDTRAKVTRNSRRGKLHELAKDATLQAHADEVQQRFLQLCRNEGLDPEEEPNEHETRSGADR